MKKIDLMGFINGSVEYFTSDLSSYPDEAAALREETDATKRAYVMYHMLEVLNDDGLLHNYFSVEQEGSLQ